MVKSGLGRRILLIISGGIAAYKSLELIRRLGDKGYEVRCVLTAGGAEFVTPLSLAALSGNKVYQNLFDLTDEQEMGHIQLSRWADLLVVAPATADLVAKMAVGLAGDLATTVLLATNKPVLIAPAMNVRMWEHPATQRNLKTLQGDGVSFVGPDEGAMACGEFGAGRMAEPQVIFEAILAALSGAPKPLAGRRAIVTAGPTEATAIGNLLGQAITSQTIPDLAAARGITWGYDSLGQVTSADSTENAHDRGYLYDSIGNRRGVHFRQGRHQGVAHMARGLGQIERSHHHRVRQRGSIR